MFRLCFNKEGIYVFCIKKDCQQGEKVSLFVSLTSVLVKCTQYNLAYTQNLPSTNHFFSFKFTLLHIVKKDLFFFFKSVDWYAYKCWLISGKIYILMLSGVSWIAYFQHRKVFFFLKENSHLWGKSLVKFTFWLHLDQFPCS